MPPVMAALADGAQVPRIVRSASCGLDDMIPDGPHHRTAAQPKPARVTVPNKDTLANRAPRDAMISGMGCVHLLRRGPPSGGSVLGRAVWHDLSFWARVEASGIAGDAGSSNHEPRDDATW